MRSVNGLVYVTAEEMSRIDLAATEEFGIDVLSLMENAGLCTATLARSMLGGDARGKRVACLAGKGNNGGDGLVAAKHLHEWGAGVVVLLSSRQEIGPIPLKQLRTVESAGIPTEESRAGLEDFDLVLDALLGYNSRGNPREPIAGIIRDANGSGVPILAVDIPSGLDATTGEANDPCIVAEATLTLGFPKACFLNLVSRRYAGQLYLGDVSIPTEVYRRYSQGENLFAEGSVVRIG